MKIKNTESNILKNFGYALSGLKFALKEKNYRLELYIATAAIILSFCFKISNFEFLLVLMAIFAVLSAELFNTSIERLSDFVEPNKNNVIKEVKDLSSSAVLVAGLLAISIGLFVFTKYFTALFLS